MGKRKTMRRVDRHTKYEEEAIMGVKIELDRGEKRSIEPKPMDGRKINAWLVIAIACFILAFGVLLGLVAR